MLAQTNYIQNAHRLDGKVAATVTDVQQGQLFQKNAAGEWEYADGTKKSYPTLNERYAGDGYGLQGERLEGRDNISRSGMLTVLKGNFEIGTDQYDKAATFTYGAPVCASTDPTKKGLVTLFDVNAASPKWHLVIGHVTHVPADADDMIRYEG